MYECEHCNALYWYAERSNKSYNTTEPKFTLCCKGGKIQLPQLQQAPRVLYDLLYNNTPKSKHFRDNIRAYNSMFQFTSIGAKIDRGISQARGPPTFILCGENYHLMGSLIPPEKNIAKFSQLYVFDTQNEIENRMAAIRGEHHKEIHEDIVRELKQMLDDNNVLVKAFRMVRDSLARYNLPNTDEVAALIVGGFDIDKTDRDIVVETQSGRLQRINQLNPAYLGLQYPLLFPFGEDGYKEDIPFNKGNQSGSKGRQEQFLVDGFSMIESSRLNYIRLDQEKLRCEMYKGIKEAVLSEETTPSSRGKGHDRVTASFYRSVTVDAELDEYDEVSMYYDCRYISPCEAAWRIFGFNIHYRDPSVVRLGFHLPNEQNVIFKDHENLEDVVRKESVKESMFLGWFQANKDYVEARALAYAELPTKFVWKRDERVWLPRKSHSVIGRIFHVPPGSGESYYMRLLLNFVRGPTSYEDIRTIDGVLYSTFKDACYARGLLDDDKEYIDAIVEASHWGSGTYLRKLFAMLLFSNSMDTPEHEWQKTWHLLSDDILHRQRRLLDNPDLFISEDELKELTLIEIERTLNTYNKSLQDFSPMPVLDISQLNSQLYANGMNRLISDELRYDKRQLALDHTTYLQQLTDEQYFVYKTVMDAAKNGKGGVFFLYGYGGTGKTFVWKTLAAALRSKSQVVLTVASSGIASLLLPGGRTAHSRFSIPLNLDEFSTCNIRQGRVLAGLLIKTKLIIWDEAPMVNRFCIEALDRTMRDILRFKNPNSLHQPFSGKTVIFGGDFRQILPVIPKGTRQEIVSATINSSYIWNDCKLLTLTKNMRLRSSDSNTRSSELKEFADWILGIGDGCHGTPMGQCQKILIPDDILVKDWDDPIEAICKVTYPKLFYRTIADEHIEDRAILALILQVVDEINQFMMSLNPTEAQTYYSSDKACPTESNNDLLASIHTPEFLNTIRCSGVPNHELTLKVGTPIMLLRNIDHSVGLCNGTRLVVTKLGKHIIEARGSARKNKASRVTHRGGLKILLCRDEDNCAETDNVVFKEVFRNVA
ncbi:uncharacterized protein [Arachis hypogaea]|uniref:uncharacterized protein n=1 Tax=Arachis hypogaea TaxID=3818 RepID=UPI003B2239B3